MVVQSLRISTQYIHAGPHPQARTESVPDLQGYVNGNAEPGGDSATFAITVDDVGKACERFRKLGVAFKKKPEDGKMKCIALILDHDGFVESRGDVF